MSPDQVDRLKRLLGHWEAAAFKGLDTQQDILDLRALLAEVERLRTTAGKFHDLYHANWMRSSPTFPDCDCELAAALRGGSR